MQQNAEPETGLKRAFAEAATGFRSACMPRMKPSSRPSPRPTRASVVAIMTGSAVITEAWREQVPAILVLWYPGMEGGRALADLLLGRANPSGRLPCVFPVRAEDLPYFDRNATQITYDLWHGYRKLERDGAQPAFPFGFGLSYTTFQLSDLRLEQTEISADGALEASVKVTNTGEHGRR